MEYPPLARLLGASRGQDYYGTRHHLDRIALDVGVFRFHQAEPDDAANAELAQELPIPSPT